MIKCNLAVILAERELSITQLAVDTGISRTTLTALYYNTGKGIQFDTLEKLCVYLDISVGELVTHIDFELTILDTIELVDDPFGNDFLFFLKLRIENESLEDKAVAKIDYSEDGLFPVSINVAMSPNLYNKLSKIPKQSLLDLFSSSIIKNDKFLNAQFKIIISKKNN